MKDNLENFIQENRADFDREIPSLKVWAAIDKEIGSTDQATAKPRKLWRYAWVAASIAFLLATGAFLGIQMNGGEDPTMASLGDFSTEYAEMEQHYNSQIQEKVALLARYNDDATVNDDLLQVDEFMEELKKELQESPKGNEEKIINAMIYNYQTKIDILERVLERIQSNNEEKSKSEENETIDI